MKTKQKQKPVNPGRRRRIWFQEILDSNIHFSTKKSQDIYIKKKTPQEITAHSKERNKSVETILEEDQRAVLLDKEFKMMVIKILKELKEDVEKVKKTMSGKKKKEIPIKI